MEATMFVSMAVIVLYLLPYVLAAGIVSEYLLVSWQGAVLAAITLVAAFVFHLWVPSSKLMWFTFAIYSLLVATTASLIVSTGGVSSPFVALWIGVTVFAGIFAMRGFVLVFGAVFAYTLLGYIQLEPVGGLIVTVIAGLLPMIASFIIWHTKSPKDDKQDKAYAELATELSHESNKSETVLNAINDGVLSIDRQGVIQLINPAAQRMIGWEKHDAVGLSYKSVVKLFDLADKPLAPALDPVENVFTKNEEVHSEDFSLQTEAGNKVFLSMVVSPVGNPTSGAIMVFRDMTKEKAEEREQAEFISTASHEMRTPVASIEGYLGLALNPATAQVDEKAREYIGKAQEAAKHLGRLFQDLLDVSRAEDGRLSNNPGVVDVIEFIDDVAEGLRSKAVEKGLRFIYKPRPDGEASNEKTVTPVLYVNVDNDHLREIMANLIENAIKYTPKGDVIVNVEGDDRHVRVSVQDSGIGIPAEDIPHLFQKFYRVDNSDTREIGGTGLGLYLCRRLAEVMSGQILVDSEYKKGSTFTLEIPRIDHLEAERLIDASTIAKEMSTPKITSPQTPGDTPIPQLQAAEPTAAPSAPVEPTPTQPTDIPGVVQFQPESDTLASPSTPAPTPQPPITSPVPSARPNVPLSAIEGNPASFTSRRPVQVPVRGPEDNK